MEFFDVISNRRSVRAFDSRPIDSKHLTQVLEAVRSCPTAGNLQAYRIYRTEQPETIAALAAAAYDQECVSGAPAVLIFCADPERSATRYRERGATLYCIQDATIATTIAHLAATALGLGSVIVGAFDEARVADIIKAPETERPIAMLPIGHPAETPKPTDRRPLDVIVTEV